MSQERLVRVNELLKREIATALYRVLTEGSFDFAAVTVTGVQAGSDLRSAHVRVSIRGHEQDRGQMLSRIRRHAYEIQKIVAKNIILKHTPRLEFVLDESIKQGDHVLDILHKMEHDGSIPAGDSNPVADEPEKEARE